MFADEFNYHCEFYRSLSELVVKKNSERVPRWVNDIKELEKFFGTNEKKVEYIDSTTHINLATSSNELTKNPIDDVVNT